MGWNDPDKEDKPKSNSGGKGDQKSPPDLEEAFKRARDFLKKMLTDSTNPSKPGSKSPGQTPPPNPVLASNISNGGKFLISMVGFVIFALWALSGIFIVNQAEEAAILRFGKYIKTVGPGPHWIPRFIESRVVVNIGRLSDYSYSAQMLTQDTNLVEVSVAVKYQVADVPAYLFNVTDPEESLRQATSSALRQVVGTTTFEQIITEGQEAWGLRVQESLIKILASYKTGILVVKVDPQSARPPENVQDAFDDAIKAREDEKRFKLRALAYKARVLPIAIGKSRRIREEAKTYALQVVLKAQGEVAEFLALLPTYLQAPMVTSERMYLDSIQQVLQKSRKVIVDSNSHNMLYLPLDKLAQALPDPVKNNMVHDVNDSSKATNEGDSGAGTDGKTNSEEAFAARDTIRNTIRQGRNN